MATTEQIAELRLFIGEPDNAAPWTDEYLGSLIDSSATVREAAKVSWETKAAGVADLVNISEAGSSRSNGALHQQYLNMAKQFDVTTTVEAQTRSPRTRQAVRG